MKMQFKHGIIALASAAFIFSAADLSAATNSIEEMAYVDLSSTTSMTQPMKTTGHYIVADASAYTGATTMTDADPVSAVDSTDLGAVTDSTIFVDMNRSANHIIGEPIYNEANTRVGTVHDVIVDRDGKMMSVVVADGGPMSAGDKKAAFDADLMRIDTATNQYRMMITEQDINDANSFSYDPTKASPSVDTLPPEGISVKKLTNTKLIDHNSEVMANIENISFDANKNIDQLIVAYNQILGMGGEEAALDFSKLRLVEDRKGIRFQMTSNQTAEFQAFNTEK